MIEMMLFTLIIGMIGFSAGWYIREQYAKRVVRQLHAYMQNTIAKNMVHIEVTEVNGMFLIHNALTGEFLAQGKTHDEITEILNQRFPGVFFTATSENLEKVGYKNESV